MKLKGLLSRFRGDEREEDGMDDRARTIEAKAAAAVARAERGRTLLDARLRAVDAYVPPSKAHR